MNSDNIITEKLPPATPTAEQLSRRLKDIVGRRFALEAEEFRIRTDLSMLLSSLEGGAR